jgi:hypothetical protein
MFRLEGLLKVLSTHGFISVISIQALVAPLRRFLARIVEFAFRFATNFGPKVSNKHVHDCPGRAAGGLPIKFLLGLIGPRTVL